MAKKPETRIQEAIQREVRMRGGFCWHPSGSIKQSGQPDLDGAFPVDRARSVWVHFKVEVKQPGKEPTEQQKIWLDWWREANYVTGSVSSVTEFWALFDDFDRVRFTVAPPRQFHARLWRLFAHVFRT